MSVARPRGLYLLNTIVVGRRVHGLVQELQSRVCSFEEALSPVSKTHATRRPVEQTHAKMRFQLRYDAAHYGRSQSKPLAA